jgi:1,4-alpha-glucan branching enzyme
MTRPRPEAVDNQSPKGWLCIVLHAHLPYIRHPECEFMLEENWLFEAITECYIPLLAMFDNLVNDRVPFRITWSLSPTLCSMLTDPVLQQRYVKYIDRLINLAEMECERTKRMPQFRDMARMYLDKFLLCRKMFVDNDSCDLVSHFRLLQDAGVFEIITSAATHGYLPALQNAPRSARAQVLLGKESYRRWFGRDPAGMWLPECGYYPGVEHLLSEAGISYFFSDAHGILFAQPRPRYGVFAPLICKDAGVAAFGRDIASSKAVWSAKEGYPGDYHYREFYRDIGFDLDIDYIRPYIDPIGIRSTTGIKYYKITGKTEDKKPYVREEALRRAAVHAGNFMFNREKQIDYCASLMDRQPIVVAPYDAELFGHWWYEGPQWLNFLIRKMAFEQNTVGLCTASDYLSANPVNQEAGPSFSSWGYKGYSEIWINGSNDWIYPQFQTMEKRMSDAVETHREAGSLAKRALNQMAREQLLAQSSDWAFIMKSGTMVNYAQRRTREHIANFTRLADDLEHDRLDKHFLSLLESHNNIFPDIDYRVFGQGR